MSKSLVTTKKTFWEELGDEQFTVDWIVQRLQEYMDFFYMNPEEREAFIAKRKQEGKKHFASLPSREGFAIYAYTTTRKLARLEKEHDIVAEKLAELDDMHRLLLEEGALNKKFDVSMSIFLLKTKHKMMEESKREYLEVYKQKKIESNDHAVAEVQSLSDEELEAAIEERTRARLQKVPA